MIANVVDAVHAIVILADFCFALDCSSSVYGGCHDDVMLLHRTASTYVRTYCTVLYVLLCVYTVRTVALCVRTVRTVRTVPVCLLENWLRLLRGYVRLLTLHLAQTLSTCHRRYRHVTL